LKSKEKRELFFWSQYHFVGGILFKTFIFTGCCSKKLCICDMLLVKLNVVIVLQGEQGFGEKVWIVVYFE